MPAINQVVEGYLVDACWAAEKMIVELDGWAFHADRRAFETDRERDAVTTAAGWVTVRITRERLRRGPEQEADRLTRILAARRPGP